MPIKTYLSIVTALFLWLSPISPANADLVYLSQFPSAADTSEAGKAQHVKELIARTPSMTQEMASEIATIVADRIDALRAHTPDVKFYTDNYGLYVHGTIIDYMPGLRTGDPSEQTNHDKFTFLPFGPNGPNPEATPILMHAYLISLVLHDFDQVSDFVWRFSNRHELLNVPFGSEQHRQSIFALVDPDGSLGMNKGGTPSFDNQLQEGLITRFVKFGVPPGPEVFRSLMWTNAAPDSFSIMAMLVPQMEQNLDRYEFEMLSPTMLLMAMAQSRKYDFIDEAIYDKARSAVAILCSMALANPDIVSMAHRAVARRSNIIGKTCIHDLETALFGGTGSVPSVSRFTSLPVSDTELREAALDVLATEEVFQHALSDPTFYRTRYLSQIVPIALGEQADDQGTKRQVLANTFIRELVAPKFDDPFTEEPYKREARQYITNEFMYLDDRALQTKRQRWLMNIYCEKGWGHSEDSIEMMRAYVDAALYYLQKDESDELNEAWQRDDLNFSIDALAMIATNIDDGEPHEAKLKVEFDNSVEKVRQRVIEYPDDAPAARFLALLSERISQSKSCR